ncbi:hypothetical protein GSI_08781 [Ganoderma sinense ZZ0214-1]|uniref:Uncharacterized protein n=1 Tax=Ganoderma sinense ZZ0214-1 TaxID=1077348 RepID=A0A2G8S4T3_9APHY|nr:hypothetical protein GSI_08781 [Ganoderma sinense ZZ0214-1]
MDTHPETETNWPEPPAYSPVHYEDKREMGTEPAEEAGRTKTHAASRHLNEDGAPGESHQELCERRAHGLTTGTPSRKPSPLVLDKKGRQAC